MANPRAYLAGPDVFLPDAVAFAEKKKAICARHGITGVFPLDADLKLEGRNLSPAELGLKISAANEALIRGAELVIANVTPFRGPSADVGTAYEMGFAKALGLPIFAYTNVVEPFTARTKAFVAKSSRRPDGQEEDGDHMAIESFDLVDNLMLAGAVVDSGGVLCSRAAAPGALYTSLDAFEACVEAAARSLS